MTVRLLQGDCRVTLPTLEPGSVQSAITSPPYMGLRDYGTPPLVWGGDAEHSHEWGDAPRGIGHVKGNRVASSASTLTNGDYQFGALSNPGRPTQQCACGAWLGSLGLEPTPDLYIEHLVECFRHVRRVLRDDGTLWLNLGDSYAGSGKGPSNSLNLSNPHAHDAAVAMSKQTTNKGSLAAPRMPLQRIGPQEHTIGHGRVPNLKPKDLMMMPARVAMALQADGWWLRSMIPWLKRNSMPESVTDRPSMSVEYVFLLSKSRTYFWDADAVRVPQGNNTHSRGNGHTPKETAPGTGVKANSSFQAATNGVVVPGGRNRRNSDWFFESWQGLMCDEDDDPLAFVVNPQPFSGSHFATFPPKLVEPMILASTRPRDVVLDPFGGAGTVGLVADRLGRNAVLCELKPEYAAMGSARIIGDAPMFADVAGGGQHVPAEPLEDKQGASGLRRYAGFNTRWDAKETTA